MAVRDMWRWQTGGEARTAREMREALVGRFSSEGLPAEFARQAAAMPPLLRRLLVEDADPSTASALAVLRASGVSLRQGLRAKDDLTRPASEMLMHQAAALSLEACSSLRGAVDKAARAWKVGSKQNGVDTVDAAEAHTHTCTCILPCACIQCTPAAHSFTR